MTHDDRLKQALGLGDAEPPVRDAGFTVEVLARIERRRFVEQLSVLALWAGVAALLGWVLARALATSGTEWGLALQPIVVALLLVGAIFLANRIGWATLAGQARSAIWPWHR